MIIEKEEDVKGFIDEVVPVIAPRTKESVEGHEETVRIPIKSAMFLLSMLQAMDITAYFNDKRIVADAKTARNDLKAQLFPTKPVKNMKPFGGPREKKGRGRPRV